MSAMEVMVRDFVPEGQILRKKTGKSISWFHVQIPEFQNALAFNVEFRHRFARM